MENLRIVSDEIQEFEEQEERAKFEITDLAGADWCFKKLQAIKKDANERINYADEEILKLKAFKEKEIEKLTADIEYFEGLLKEYTDKRLKENPDFKVKTANGTASYGKLQYKWDYYDEDLLIKTLEERNFDKFIKIKKSVDKTNLKKNLTIAGEVAVDENGEVVDGIKITEFKNFNVKY